MAEEIDFENRHFWNP